MMKFGTHGVAARNTSRFLVSLVVLSYLMQMALSITTSTSTPNACQAYKQFFDTTQLSCQTCANTTTSNTVSTSSCKFSRQNLTFLELGCRCAAGFTQSSSSIDQF